MSLQEKSEEKYSIAERLKKLRLERQWKWAEFANKLGLSESMMYAVIAGRNSLGEMAVYRLELLEKETAITKLTTAAEEVVSGQPGSAEDQQELFNRLVIEYGELKDKMTTVEEIIARMSKSRSIKSYRDDSKSEQETRGLAQHGAGKVFEEAQQADAESGSSQTGQSPSGKSGGPKVPSRPRRAGLQTPPNPVPK